jgi:hypothetical protein
MMTGDGLDGFWVHRSLEVNDIESHVVDPASIAVSRQRRRAKTDAIDGGTLLRTFLAWKRGEPRVCEMVVPPTPEQEDHRRLSRERANLLAKESSVMIHCTKIGTFGAWLPNSTIRQIYPIKSRSYKTSFQFTPRHSAVPVLRRVRLLGRPNCGAFRSISASINHQSQYL